MSAEKVTKRTLLLSLLACLSVSTATAAQSLTEVLAQRSGLRASEVSSLLASCDANQTSMTFCAWRDQLVAERALLRLIDEKRTASPSCAATLTQKVAAWQKQRDTSCRESAKKQWGNGSMMSAAVAMCERDRTKQMTQSLSANTCQ